MNTEFFIAKRIVSGKQGGKRISRPILSITIIGISLGMIVMILAISIVSGFKEEIRNKVTGFGSHISITNFDSNLSYETKPVDMNQNFYPGLEKITGIRHIQVFATKPGIISTGTDIQGVILKGVGSDYDWSFFREHLTNGSCFNVSDTGKTDKILLSEKLTSMLKLKLGDKVMIYFVEQPPRARKFTIQGIYNTGLEEFDKTFIIVDIHHVQKLNNWTDNQISGFEIQIDDFGELDDLKRKVTDIVGLRFNSDGSMLKIQSIIEKEPILFDWIGLFNINVWIILILMVLVAGVNMISGLLILILERTSMIGTLKALGAHNRSIKKIFLYNGAFLIGKGMIWGNVIALILCLIQKYFGLLKLDPASYYVKIVPVRIDVLEIILLNAGTFAITLVMLLLPAMIIARITPVKAIRFN
ncbi:MAG: ABC transporter permease [Bacteroidia bacterium]|nr:ABC transporter permease [Bacteroidia bacterium]